MLEHERVREETIRRFWAKVDVAGPDECWVWLAGRSTTGYGRFRDSTVGKSEYAHRFAWLIERGDIPPGLELDHLCRNRLCVNPDHLEPVDHRTNALRGVGPSAMNAAKTHCVHGHPFDEENTYVRQSGGRMCRQCLRRRWRELYRRRATSTRVGADR